MSSISKLGKQLDIVYVNYETNVQNLMYNDVKQVVKSFDKNLYPVCEQSISNIDETLCVVNDRLIEMNKFYQLNVKNQEQCIDAVTQINNAYKKKDFIDELTDLPRYGEKTKQKIVELNEKGNKIVELCRDFTEGIGGEIIKLQQIRKDLMEIEKDIDSKMKLMQQENESRKRNEELIKAQQNEEKDKQNQVQLHEVATSIRDQQMNKQQELLQKINILIDQIKYQMECFDTFYSNDKQNMKYLLAYMKAMECKCDKRGYQLAKKTLCEILDNIINHPDNPVYTTLSGANKLLFDQLLHIQHTVGSPSGSGSATHDGSFSNIENKSHDTVPLPKININSISLGVMCLLCCGFKLQHMYLPEMLQFQQHPETIPIASMNCDSVASSGNGTNDIMQFISNYACGVDASSREGGNMADLDGSTVRFVYKPEPDPEESVDEWSVWYEHLTACYALVSES